MRSGAPVVREVVTAMTARASEINVHGTFEWKDLRVEAEILREIEAGKSLVSVWSPSTDDFEKVALRGKTGTTIRISSWFQLLGVIIQTGSISRLNVFTHGKRAFVGFQGDLVRGDVLMDPKTAMTVDNLQELHSLDHLDVKGKKNQRFRPDELLKEVHKRFEADAKIILYACDSGADLELLNTVRDTFQVTVIGFKLPIAYKVNVVGGRKHSVEIGYTFTQTKTDFHDLDLNDPEHVIRVPRKVPQPIPKPKP